MKNVFKKSAVAFMAAAMVMGSATMASANTVSDKVSEIGSFAKEIWGSLSEEEQQAILSEMNELMEDEEIQDNINSFIASLPEGTVEDLAALASDLLGSGEGLDVMSHDELLEETGIDLPGEEEGAYYSLTATEDGVDMASAMYQTGDYFILLYAMDAEDMEMDDALSYFPVFEEEEAEETTVNGYDGYNIILEEDGYVDGELAWLDTDEDVFYEVMVSNMEDPMGVDADTMIELMEAEIAQ